MSEFNEIKFNNFAPDPTRDQRVVRKLLSNHGNIPSAYLNACLEEVAGEEGDRLRKWWEFYRSSSPFKRTDLKRRNSLIFHGGFGFGKTGAACAMARMFSLHNTMVWFERELDMEEAFRDSERRKKARRSWLLVLDDVGAAANDNFGKRRDALESLIRFRYDANLPTIITTNLDKDGRKEVMGSFMTIVGECYTLIKFSTKNWRGGNAKENKFRV